MNAVLAPLRRPLAALLPLVPFAAPAAAIDFYVDPLNGDDANSGLSPNEAWRHVSFALSVVQPGDHAVHLAPGVYDVAGGEVFPLPVRSGVLVVGDGGSEVTRIADCGSHGLYVQAGHPEGGAFASAYLVDSTVEVCGGNGVYATSNADVDDSWITTLRSTLRGNLGWGLHADGSFFGGGQADVTDSLVVGNGIGGVSAGAGSRGRLALLRSTVADNSGAGVVFYGDTTTATLESSILYGDGDQVSGPSAAVTARYCCVDDLNVPPHPTNFAGDPRFVDASAGDDRLRFGSRCLDAGDPTPPPGPAFDVDGTPRPLDGDLDTAKAPDMGAHELAPLMVTGEPHIGTDLTLDLWSPAGGRTLLYFTEAPLIPPMPTPFGELELDRATAVLLGSLPTAPGPPAPRFLPLPNDPTRVGDTWSLQGLCLGSSTQPLRALTNAVSFQLLP